MVGWGKEDGGLTGAPNSHVLKQAQLPLIAQEKCRGKLEGFEDAFVSPSRNLCTLDGCSGACMGDSGSGLFCTVAGREDLTVPSQVATSS